MSKVFQQGLTVTRCQKLYVDNPGQWPGVDKPGPAAKSCVWINQGRLSHVLLNKGMQFTSKGLKADGFAGFRPIGSLEVMRVPQATGLFAVLAPVGFQPRFLKKSTAGVFKKKDPSLPEPALAAEWVDTAVVLYLGKAGPGSKGNRGLRRQVQEFLDFGQGKPPGHWDGRLVWQLADAEKLLIAWKELPAENLGKAEADYHTAFVEEHSKLPFANLVRARTKG